MPSILLPFFALFSIACEGYVDGVKPDSNQNKSNSSVITEKVKFDYKPNKNFVIEIQVKDSNNTKFPSLIHSRILDLMENQEYGQKKLAFVFKA